MSIKNNDIVVLPTEYFILFCSILFLIISVMLIAV